MTMAELIAFGTGAFSIEGSSEEGYGIDFNFRDGDFNRREPMFYGLSRKEANDIVKTLKEAQRKIISKLETYQDRIYS